MSRSAPLLPVQPLPPTLSPLRKLLRRIRFLVGPELHACNHCGALRYIHSMTSGPLYGDFCDPHCRWLFWLAHEWEPPLNIDPR